MNILILGSGGREYSIGLALKNEKSHNLYFMPGNGATSDLGKNINITDYEKLAIFAKENSIDLTIVGPEGPLVDGVVDIFKKYELTIFGPSRQAAQLEGSKAYMKNILKKYNIPTAAFIETSNKQDAYDFIDGMKNLPIVVKADGLCGGKGVIIAQSKEEAKKTVDDMLNGEAFGEAGEKVIVEEFLDGYELSVFAICDGENYKILPAAQDHKRVGDGDTGPNTGGMGTAAPSPEFTEAHQKDFEENILKPTLEGLHSSNIRFKGFIFFGLMVTNDGTYLLEYNMRLGDPETQVIMALLENNLYDVIMDCLEGNEIELKFSDQKAVCLVMCSGGYPRQIETGFEIRNIDKVKDSQVLFAGAKMKGNQIFTTGGRVLSLVATGDTFEEAREKVYQGADVIHYDYEYYRDDIAKF